MPRDRDAIESMFNRGGGRIYELPDKLIGSADKQTAVDNETIYSNTDILSGKAYATTRTTNNPQGEVKDNPMAGDMSKISSNRMISNMNIYTIGFNDTTTLGSRIPQHANVDWIIKKGLK